MSDESQETEPLRVDPETVIRGLELDERPGATRHVMFRRSTHGGHSEGELADLSGVTQGPLALRPRAFVDEDQIDPNPEAARRVAREEAADDPDADPDAWADEASSVWRDHVRAALVDEVVVNQTGETRSVKYVDPSTDDAR